MTTIASPTKKKQRDIRLDFFRGLCLFIIFVAHMIGNPWADWIPAKFGFSDATEIFVFCSGMASAVAFGAAFRNHGFFIGCGPHRVSHLASLLGPYLSILCDAVADGDH